MSDDSNESSLIDIPENPDYLQFATNFVNYVIHIYMDAFRIEDRNPVRFRYVINSSFDETFRRAVDVIIVIMEERIINWFYPILYNNIVNENNFLILAREFERNVNERGFDPRIFLFESSSVSIVAALFYMNGARLSPDLAVAYITYILQYHMPVDGWNNVRRVAEIYANHE